MGKKIFTIVPGTWADQAEWRKESFPLTRALRQNCVEVQSFGVIEWPGSNQFAARIKAADEIEKRIRKVAAEHPEAAHFLIGHSHGGSAIAYCLQREPALIRHLAGTAFLSTPFVSARLRPNAASQFALLANSFAILIILSAVPMITYVASQLASGIRWLSIAIVGALPTLTLKLLGTVFKRVGKSRQAIQTTIEQYTHSRATTGVPTTNVDPVFYKIVRTTGDEASAGLAISQLLLRGCSLLSRKTYALMEAFRSTFNSDPKDGSPSTLSPLLVLLLPIVLLDAFALRFYGNWLNSVIRDGDYAYVIRSASYVPPPTEPLGILDNVAIAMTAVGLCALMAPLLVWATLKLVTSASNRWARLAWWAVAIWIAISSCQVIWSSVSHYVPIGIAAFKRLFEAMGSGLDFWLNLMGLSMTISIVIIVLITGALFAIETVGLVSAMAFGASPSVYAPFVEFSVESVPVGDWPVTTVSGGGSFGLRHSQVYSSPQALDSLVRWIEERSERESVTGSR